MYYTQTTETGKIKYDEGIIASIATAAVDEVCPGRVFPSTPKGRLIRDAGIWADDDDDFMKVEESDGKLNVTLYYIINFGASIKQTADLIDRRFRELIPGITGMKAGTVRIIFTGVRSRNISKRHIEAVTYGDE
jgi:uncharacterized alkaline shock family protein YloU